MGRMVYFTDTDPFAPSYGSLQGFFYQPTNGDGSRRSVFSNRKGVLSDPICVGRFPTLVVDVAELAPSHSFIVIFFGVRLGAPLAPPSGVGWWSLLDNLCYTTGSYFFPSPLRSSHVFCCKVFPHLSFSFLHPSPPLPAVGRRWASRPGSQSKPNHQGGVHPALALPSRAAPPPDQNHRVYPDLHAVVG